MPSSALPRLTRCLCGSGNQVESLAAEIHAEFGLKDFTDEEMEAMSVDYEKGEPVCLKSGTQIKSKDQKWQR